MAFNRIVKRVWIATGIIAAITGAIQGNAWAFLIGLVILIYIFLASQPPVSDQNNAGPR